MAVINVHRHETNVWAQFAMATARLDTFVETAKQNILRADPTADIVVLGPTRIQQALHLDDAQKFRDLQAHIGRLSGVIEKLSSRLYLALGMPLRFESLWLMARTKPNLIHDRIMEEIDKAKNHGWHQMKPEEKRCLRCLPAPLVHYMIVDRMMHGEEWVS